MFSRDVNNNYLINFDKWLYLNRLDLIISNYKRDVLHPLYYKLLNKEIAHSDYYDNYNSHSISLIKLWNSIYYHQ